MTINNAKVNNFRKNMEESAAAYVRAYNEHKPKKELKSMKSLAKAALDSYNLELSKATYQHWAEIGDPIKQALIERFVPGAQKCSFKTDDNDVMVAVFKDAEYEINLPMMQVVLGADAFADADWFAKIEKLAWIIAGRVNVELGEKVGFEYKISDAANAFDFDGDITSIDGVSAALQSVFDSILFIADENGENKIKADVVTLDDGSKICKAWYYVREAMTRRGGDARGQIVVGNTGLMTSLIADAMHVILTSRDFCARADEVFSFPTDAEPEACDEVESEE